MLFNPWVCEHPLYSVKREQENRFSRELKSNGISYYDWGDNGGNK